jgi:hypothetical protein
MRVQDIEIGRFYLTKRHGNAKVMRLEKIDRATLVHVMSTKYGSVTVTAKDIIRESNGTKLLQAIALLDEEIAEGMEAGDGVERLRRVVEILEALKRRIL